MESKSEKTGKAKGGIARAESLSSEERKAIARKAAVARWGLVAIHKGNFKEEFGIDVDCYVLNDDAKTAVISKRGMGAALGYTGQGGTNLRLIKQKPCLEYVGPELAQKLKIQLNFKGLEWIRTINQCQRFTVTM